MRCRRRVACARSWAKATAGCPSRQERGGARDEASAPANMIPPRWALAPYATPPLPSPATFPLPLLLLPSRIPPAANPRNWNRGRRARAPPRLLSPRHLCRHATPHLVSHHPLSLYLSDAHAVRFCLAHPCHTHPKRVAWAGAARALAPRFLPLAPSLLPLAPRLLPQAARVDAHRVFGAPPRRYRFRSPPSPLSHSDAALSCRLRRSAA